MAAAKRKKRAKIIKLKNVILFRIILVAIISHETIDTEQRTHMFYKVNMRKTEGKS